MDSCATSSSSDFKTDVEFYWYVPYGKCRLQKSKNLYTTYSQYRFYRSATTR